MTSKKNYWYKNKREFMLGDEVDFLMDQDNGAQYVLLYQYICMMCINTNGVLAREVGNTTEPFSIQKIKRDCKYFTEDTIIVALELYKKLGMMECTEEGYWKITDFSNIVGSETNEAVKKRKQRQNNKLKQIEDKKGDNVHESVYDNVHTDIRDKSKDNRDIYSVCDTCSENIDSKSQEDTHTKNPKEIYKELCDQYGKAFVDERVTRAKGYNNITWSKIRDWCEMDYKRNVGASRAAPSANRFNVFQQKGYDMNELEEALLSN